MLPSIPNNHLPSARSSPESDPAPPVASLAGRRVLVTGATGFIGGHLADRLVAAGARVTGVSRRPPPAADGMSWVRADLTEPGRPAAVLDEVRPDVLFHLASTVTGTRDRASVGPVLRANLVAAVDLMATALDCGTERVVLTGSVEEPEPDDPVPSSPYAAAKWAATGYARCLHALYGLPVTVLRLAMVYGPGQGDGTKLVPYTATSLLSGREPRIGSGTREVDWVYVDDVVDALLAAAARPGRGDVLTIGSGTSVTIRETVELLDRIVGAGVHPRFGAVPDRPLDTARIADPGPAGALLGWRPRVSLAEGLSRTVDWYRDALVGADHTLARAGAGGGEAAGVGRFQPSNGMTRVRPRGG